MAESPTSWNPSSEHGDDGGGGGDASTVIWSVNFSDIADHDFLAGGASQTIDLGGVNFTAQGNAKADKLEIHNGELIFSAKANSGHSGSAHNAPELRASFNDLMTYGAKSGAYDEDKMYVFRGIMTEAYSPGAGGHIVGFGEIDSTADKDISMQRSGGNWRMAKGSSKFYGVSKDSTGMTVPYRSLAVMYTKGVMSLSASADTEEGKWHGGTVVFVGYARQATRTGLQDSNYTYVSSGTPLINFAASTAYAGVGGWYWSGGNPGDLKFERLELHEVG